MTVSEARAALPEVLDRVEAGEEVTLTRHGKPVAVVLRPDRVRTRRKAAEEAITEATKLREMREAARRRPLGPGVAMSEARVEEHIAEIRAGRDAR
jgi:antitoxin (DNA-binding transcriptional repressor) of toxin-antitoxin stability system